MTASIPSFARLRRIVSSRRFFLFVWILMLVIGLITVPDYGHPTDEEIEMRLVKGNYLEYIDHIFGPDSSLVRMVDNSGKLLRISESRDRDRGVAAYYLFAPLFKLPGDRAVMLAWHAYTFVLFMLGVAALYGIVKKLTRRKWLPCLAAVMLYLSPRMFAEGHYNNKDIVLLSLVLITIHCGIRYIQTHSLRHGILFAIAGAFAANDRLPGFWAFGCIGIFYIGLLIRNREFTKKRLGVGLLTILAFFATFFLITPACWSDPVEFFQYMFVYSAYYGRWVGDMYFDGIYVVGAADAAANLPWYYLPYAFFMSTPLYIQVLILLGVALLISRLFARKGLRTGEHAPMFALITFLWLAPFVYAIAAGTLLYNGWRHMYFCYGPMLVTAMYSLEFLLDRLKPVSARVLTGIVCVLVLAMGVSDIVYHPYQYAYLNLLCRQDAADRHEIDYWNLSVMNAIEELVESDVRNRSLPILLSGMDSHTAPAIMVVDNMPEEVRQQVACTTDYESANYWVACPSYAVISVDLPCQTRKVVSITAYGNEIMAVYERVIE